MSLYVAENPRFTHLQQRFVQEYLIDSTNARAAAIRAGYSPINASNEAYKMLRKPHIVEAIEEGRKDLSKRVGITQERVLQELAKIAFASIGDIVTINAETGETEVDLTRLPKDVLSAISDVNITSVDGKTKTKNTIV